MKTFKQFLNEAVHTNGGMREVFQFLVKASNKNTDIIDSEFKFFRGVRQKDLTREVLFTSDDNYVYHLYECDIRKDRKPADTASELSAYMNEWYIENGFGPVRTGGAFVMGGHDAGSFASSYGTRVGLVFAASTDTTFVWSDIRDAYETIDRLGINPVTGDPITSHRPVIQREDIKSVIFNMLAGANVKASKDPSIALASGGETVLMADSYLMLFITEKETGYAIGYDELETFNKILQGDLNG